MTMHRSTHAPLDADERALAERLSQGDRVRGPSAALDASILAAAAAQRDGAASFQSSSLPRPRAAARGTRPRWPVAFGIAASLALAVGIAWQLRPLPGNEHMFEHAETPAVSADATPAAASGGPSAEAAAASVVEAEPAPAPAAAAMAPQPARPIIPASERRKAAAVARPEETTALPLPAPQPAQRSVAPPAPPAPIADTAAPVAFPAGQNAAAARATQHTPALAAPAAVQEQHEAAVARQHAPAGANADAMQVQAAWLDRIRELLAAGEHQAARDSLHAFRMRYPQAAIPADLKPLAIPDPPQR